MSAEAIQLKIIPFNTALTIESLGDIPGNTLQQHYIDEVNDRPDIRLDTLAAAERGKLFFRFVSAVHIDSYRTRIAEAAGRADYYISEGVINSPSNFRPVLDVVSNLTQHGKGTSYRLPLSIRTDDDQGEFMLYGQLAPETEASTLLNACRDAIARTSPESPVLRTMDMSTKDIIPGTSMNLEQAHLMEGRARAAGNFLEDTNDSLLRVMDARVRTIGATLAARNERQYSDISTIAANAVLRHPEKDKIVVAVLHGMGHDAVAQRVLSQPDIEGEHIYVPASEGAGMAHLLTLQNRAYDELLTEGMISREMRQRLLLNVYAGEAARVFNDMYSRSSVLQAVEYAALNLDSSQVNSLLDLIDDLKFQVPPLLKRIARRYIMRRIANLVLSEIATGVDSSLL